MVAFGISERRACKSTGFNRSSQRYAIGVMTRSPCACGCARLENALPLDLSVVDWAN
jgi:hypothetical protein